MIVLRNLRHRTRVRFLLHELTRGNLLRSPARNDGPAINHSAISACAPTRQHALLRPAVADESDAFGAVPSAAPANAPDNDGICNALAAAAQENDLPIDFFTRLIWQESRFDPTAVSRAGAQGVAQFMPATA